MVEFVSPSWIGARRRATKSARRELTILIVLVSAVMLFIWNGGHLFNYVTIRDGGIDDDAKILLSTLTLNLALVLFGWRRYIDMVHEEDQRLESEQRAAMLATTDALTGLHNRKGFADLAETLAKHATSYGGGIVIMSVQMNRFKHVNDRYGYDVGDRLMRSIAQTLRNTMDDDAIVARISGDEFAAAMVTYGEMGEQVSRLAATALQGVTRLFDIDGRMVQVGAFLGIASSEHADIRIPDLLRRADIALDHAKSARSVKPVWFDAGMERALIRHGEIEQGIRQGLENHQFIPFFEPQIDLTNGEIIGFEVLARWDHPLSGIIGPDIFIPVAEEMGLIGRLSEQVIRAALSKATSWDPSIKLSVNISPFQLADSWLAQRIVRILNETGFPADRLVVEITESALFADLDLARTIVTSLKNQGIRIALDDFGTGFSSLSHLRSLPFDAIKVDRSFTATIGQDKESEAIIRAVTTLASALNLPVTIEGVEDAATHMDVMKIGCSVGQGWYFGKPMSADQAAQLLRDRHLVASADEGDARAAG